MKLISAVVGATTLALTAFAGSASAQYYSAPVISSGGGVNLGYTGNVGYTPYYTQPYYTVQRSYKPIWALGQPVSLGNPHGNLELSFYTAAAISSPQSVPFLGTFDFDPSLGLGGRLAWNDPLSNVRVSGSMTAYSWEVEDFWDGTNDIDFLGNPVSNGGDFSQLSTDIGIGIYERNSWLSALVGTNTDLDGNYALPYAGVEFGTQTEIAPGVAIDLSLKGVREFSEATIRGFRTSGRWIASGTMGLRIKF